jgi:hypothetical protein
MAFALNRLSFFQISINTRAYGMARRVRPACGQKKLIVA